jgi:hypothetical protein
LLFAAKSVAAFAGDKASQKIKQRKPEADEKGYMKVINHASDWHQVAGCKFQRKKALNYMDLNITNNSKLMFLSAFISLTTTMGFAGQAIKWEEVPAPVRATILANGGASGQSVDKESETKDGKAIYEAGVKGKDGNISDLNITEDGKLIETKHDDASDATAEKEARAKKVLAGVKFSHPRDITNPFLPLASLKQDIIEGTEGGKKMRVERTQLPDKHKTFTVGGCSVEALVMEDRAFVNGVLEEVATDYFAQDDAGTVYYLGEDVDEYDEKGKLASHNPSNDAWLVGKDTPVPGVILPAHPKVGDKFKSEDVSREINESDEVVAVGESITVPAGTFTNCLKVKETLGDGSIEFKYYAPFVGVVREIPSDGDELLVSHTTNEVAK